MVYFNRQEGEKTEQMKLETDTLQMTFAPSKIFSGEERNPLDFFLKWDLDVQRLKILIDIFRNLWYI